MKIYSAYEKAWVKYYKNVYKFDRSISKTGIPRNQEEHQKMAANAKKAHTEILWPYMPIVDKPSWVQAKESAYRRVFERDKGILKDVKE